MDDLSLLEVINLLTIGISSFNIRSQVPNDIPTHNGYIIPQNLQTQDYINQICDWTERKKMCLNIPKSNLMCFNFTNNFQFTTRIEMNGHTLKVLDQTKLLGVIITSDLKWSENTKYLIKRANARMEILRKLAPFNPPIEDMKTIYISFIRSILEQSCVIWHPSLTEHDRMSLERVQKNAFRNILQEKYENYENSLSILQMDSLYNRREKLMLSYSKKCLSLNVTKDMFPLNTNEHGMNTRSREKYQVTHANTSRLMNSTVPYMQRLLNKEYNEKHNRTNRKIA